MGSRFWKASFVLVVATTLCQLALQSRGPMAHARASRGESLTLFLHGDHPLGELEEMPNVDEPTTTFNERWMYMTSEKIPESLPPDPPKSTLILNYVIGPNYRCGGNGYFPVWEANLKGTVTDATVVLHTVAAPMTRLNIELHRDLNRMTCFGVDAAYEFPLIKEVDVPAGVGEVKVHFNNINLRVHKNLLLQVEVAVQSGSNGQARIVYDSAEFPSSVTLTCAQGCKEKQQALMKGQDPE